MSIVIAYLVKGQAVEVLRLQGLDRKHDESDEQFLVRCLPIVNMQAQEIPNDAPRLIMLAKDLPDERWKDAWVFYHDIKTEELSVIVSPERARQMVLQQAQAQIKDILDKTQQDYMKVLAQGTAEEKGRAKAYRTAVRQVEDTVAKEIKSKGVKELEEYKIVWPAPPA